MKPAGFAGDLNQGTWSYPCENGSVIFLFPESIKGDPDLDRWKGLEVNGLILEEAPELEERSWYKAIERAGSWVVPSGEQPPPLILLTSNPAVGWVKRLFHDPWKSGTLAPPYYYLPATIHDNPHLPPEYLASLRNLPEQEYKRFVEGDWETSSGRYYDTLNPRVHLIPRANLPSPLPDWWEYWGSFDWGYRHWSVACAWARDGDGTTYLLDSLWQRQRQDDQLARNIAATLPAPCLGEVYAGHDCWARVIARGGSGVQTSEVFEAEGIYLVKADIDRVNGGRALRRAFLTTPITNEQGLVLDAEGFPTYSSPTYVIDTPGNKRVWDQLAETVPDPDHIEEPLKVDADADGNGGDDGADAARYGLSTRAAQPTDPSPGAEVRAQRAKLDSLSRTEADTFDKLAERYARKAGR